MLSHCWVSEGIWYELGRYEYDIEVATSCVVVRTWPQGAGFVGESINVPSSSPEHLRGECNIVDDSGRGVLNFTLSSGGEAKKTRQLPKVVVIYNEGDNIINYSCLEDEANNKKEEFAWIFSRKPQIVGVEREDFISTIRSLDVLDINKFIWIDQSQCN
ncbi:bilin-binding protein-like [Aricia agestis]|uniref:bilin-binding protein-like n=1 Tax=Aricia agestis TaxID=91739 RepID=UPI001C2084C3|nr:bilin-binding protein-like [Aricia agestis]